jgi:hypothetical protein
MRVKDFMTKRFSEMLKDSRFHRLEVERKCEDLKREIKAKVRYEEQLQEDETLASQRQQQLAQEHRQHVQR